MSHPYRFKVGQVIGNNKVVFRWHGKGGNFYDVESVKNGTPWTYSEEELQRIQDGKSPYTDSCRAAKG